MLSLKPFPTLPALISAPRHRQTPFPPSPSRLPLRGSQASNNSNLPAAMAGGGGRKRSYWLLKTEPGDWSWDHQRANGGLSRWDGVRNRQAVNYLKSMRPDDLCFFYHSGSAPASRCIVGVVRVTKPWYLIGDGDVDGAVDVKEVGKMKRRVELKEIKKVAEKETELKGFALIKQPRLSVVPVADCVWERLCEMGGGFCEGNDEHGASEEE